MNTLPTAGAGYLDDLYARFLKDPLSIDPSLWAMFAPYADRSDGPRPAAAGDGRIAVACERLKTAWRLYGHLAASLDPLDLNQAPGHPDLSPDAHGLDESDLDVDVGGTTPRN